MIRDYLAPRDLSSIRLWTPLCCEYRLQTRPCLQTRLGCRLYVGTQWDREKPRRVQEETLRHVREEISGPRTVRARFSVLERGPSKIATAAFRRRVCATSCDRLDAAIPSFSRSFPHPRPCSLARADSPYIQNPWLLYPRRSGWWRFGDSRSCGGLEPSWVSGRTLQYYTRLQWSHSSRWVSGV
jgi:hypothetical protein